MIVDDDIEKPKKRKSKSKFYQIENYYPYLKHPEKYLREDKIIKARSGLEIEYFRNFDINKNIIQWQSEGIAIPYKKPIFDGVGRIIRFEIRKYYPDVHLIMKNKNGEIQEILGEIKPYKQIIKPELKNRKTQKSIKNYVNEKCVWFINICKWKAANSFAKAINEKYKRNITFYLFLEDNKTINFKDIKI